MDIIVGREPPPKFFKKQYVWLRNFWIDIARGTFSEDILIRIGEVLECGENHRPIPAPGFKPNHRWNIHIADCFRNLMENDPEFVLGKVESLKRVLRDEERPYEHELPQLLRREFVPPPFPAPARDFHFGGPPLNRVDVANLDNRVDLDDVDRRFLFGIAPAPAPVDEPEPMDTSEDASPRRQSRNRKSSPRKSLCHSKKAKSCKKSPRCTWSKGYDRKNGKHVNGNCRRKKSPGRKSPKRKSMRRKSPGRK